MMEAAAHWLVDRKFTPGPLGTFHHNQATMDRWKMMKIKFSARFLLMKPTLYPYAFFSSHS